MNETIKEKKRRKGRLYAINRHKKELEIIKKATGRLYEL